MCQYEGCKGLYGAAYKGSESVYLEVSVLCPKCCLPVKAESFVHFGGEIYQPALACHCGWGLFVTVKPKTAFLSRKD